jgi:glycerophosphoryl diester phosphodiesterase
VQEEIMLQMPAWPYPKLFAHRGGGTLAPENTLAGMKVAAEHLYTAVEFDVKLSKDGIAFLMHDDTLERTTNGVGTFKDKTAAELETLDASGWMETFLHGTSNKNTIEKIPRFSAVMQYLHAQGINANIEIKPCAGREVETGMAVAALAEEITRTHSLKPLITSFSVEALRAAKAVVRNTASRLPFGLLVEEYLHAHDAILDELECVSLHCDHKKLNAEIVQHLHARGTRVLTYAVNQVDQAAALFKIGVDGIFTDQLSDMAAKFPKGLSAH